MSYEQKLMQMKKLLKKKEQEPEKEKVRSVPKAPAYEAEWLRAGLEKEENEFGIVYKREVLYNEGYTHGDFTLADLAMTIERWKASGEEHPMTPDFTLPLLFFDTETTGLKGTGTLIFLVGIIEMVGTSFRLTQYVLPGPDHEPAFLYATPFWKEPHTIVTYNGKSFDIPQLQTRWTMNRKDLPPLLEHTHIDLLHGSRRIWKGDVNAFTLTTIEKEKLGFHRDGDIPGYLAPIIYQDAVKQGRAELLMKVLQHNEWDILSLVTLYIHATELLLTFESTSSSNALTNIGKWFSDLKSFDRSKEIFEFIVGEDDLDESHAYWHLGFLLKREQRYEEAADSFEKSLIGVTGKQKVIALEELAKLYEHKLKELSKALTYTTEGIQVVTEGIELSDSYRERALGNYRKREIRLRNKIISRASASTDK